jgi:hypothetical protein
MPLPPPTVENLFMEQFLLHMKDKTSSWSVTFDDSGYTAKVNGQEWAAPSHIDALLWIAQHAGIDDIRLFQMADFIKRQ